MQETLIEKAKSVRLLTLDIDGICTDGRMVYSSEGEISKSFYGLDGLGIKLIQNHGIEVGVISAKNSEAVTKRMSNLGVKYLYLGQEEKLSAYQLLRDRLQLSDHQIAYMGDDLPDLPILRRVGLAISVPNAASTVKEYVHMITQNPGGHGAVREVCEFILKAQEKWESALANYLI